MKALIKTTNRTFDKDRMHLIRDKVRGQEFSDKNFQDMYKLHKKSLLKRAEQIRQLSDQEILEISMAGAYALKLDMPKYLKNTEIDIEDLNKYLNFNLKTLYNPKTKEFRKLRIGLNFLDSFTRKYYTNVSRTEGALADTLEKLQEVFCISLHIATPKTRMTTSRLFSTYLHASKNRVQFASNFNTLISAYLFNYYGLKSAKARKSKTIYLHSSSEGWLSRMFGSLLVAIKNPNYQIVYNSIDPNIKVIEAFKEARKFLLEYTKVKNWEANIYNAGSEEVESYQDTKLIGVSFTSPPYLDLEAYPDTTIVNKDTTNYKISNLDKVETTKGIIAVDDLKIGDTIIRYKREIRVKTLSKTNQVATLYKTARKFNEFFIRPTIKNIKNNSVKGSYLILNVVDFKEHKSFEKDTVEIAEQEGYKLIDTKRYPLVRKPGKAGDTRLADVKKNYEPIFVFEA